MRWHPPAGRLVLRAVRTIRSCHSEDVEPRKGREVCLPSSCPPAARAVARPCEVDEQRQMLGIAEEQTPRSQR